jgi:hypothetical protein
MKKFTITQAEAIINSIDGIERASPGPFFYHQLLNKIDQKINAEQTWAIQYKPAILAMIFFAFLLINAFMLLKQPLSLNNSIAASNTEINSIESFSEEYNMNSSAQYLK